MIPKSGNRISDEIMLKQGLRPLWNLWKLVMRT